MKTITLIDAKKNAKSLEKDISRVVVSLEQLLETNLDSTITVRFHYSRDSFDGQAGRKTKNWEVGSVSKDGNVEIFHPDAFESHSSHKKSEFTQILKHELAHIFIAKIANGNTIPRWLDEGVVMYLAGQVSKYKNESSFYIESKYYAKLDTQYGWDQYVNYDAYKYSCLFVNFLIENYSLSLLVKLINSLNLVYYQPHFDSVFSKVMGIEIAQTEFNFIESLTQKK